MKEVTPQMLFMANTMQAMSYFTIAEKHRIKEQDILLINFYKSTDVRAGETAPVYRLFLLENDYITQERVTQGLKWRTGCLFSVLPFENDYHWYSNWYKKIQSTEPKTKKRILDFCKKKVDKDCGNNEYLCLAMFQEVIMAERLKRKHIQIKRKIDEQMDLVPKLPEDFDEWCDKEVLFQSRYIYYRKRKKDKAAEGYCTYCHSDVLVESPRHNHKGTCPNCKKEITFKAVGYAKRINDKATAAVIQKAGEGIVIRQFIVNKLYTEDFKNPKLTWSEEIRYFKTDKEEKNFEWKNFKQTGEFRWCETGIGLYITRAVVYRKGLESELEGIRWKHCILAALAGIGRTTDSVLCLKMYFNNPYLEKFSKAGLFKLVDEIVERNCYIGKELLNTSESKLHKILRLNRNYFKLFRQLNLGMRGLDMIQKMQAFHINFKPEEFQYFVSKYGYNWKLLSFRKYASIHKIDRYLTTASEKEKKRTQDVFILWRDYIYFCQKLGYHLRNEFVLFPNNLRRSHDLLMQKVRNLSDEEKAEQLKKLEEKAVVLFAELNKKLYWQNKDYLIRVPYDHNEIIQEGEALHHCVGIQEQYFENMIYGNGLILFLRKLKNPDKPFYTIELVDGKVSQCMGMCGERITTEIEKVIKQFLAAKIQKKIFVKLYETVYGNIA